MKISLTQNEIENAIIAHLTQVIHLTPNQEFRVEMAATRGSAGFTADVSIVQGEAKETPSRSTMKESEKPDLVALVQESDGETQAIEEPPVASPRRVSLFAGIKQA